MTKLLVGLTSTPDKYGNLERCRRGLDAVSKTLGFDVVVSTRNLSTRQDAEAVAREFTDQGVDFVLLLCNTFIPEGSIVLPLASSTARLGLWALPEPTREGPLPLTSLVDLNLFASVLHTEGTDRDLRYKWFLGEADDPSFRRRLEVTIRALRVIKGLKEAKIGYIGGYAPGFDNLAFDERVLEQNLGVRVITLPFSSVLETAQECGESEARDRGVRISARAAQVACTPQDVLATGRIALALERLAENHEFSAMAVACWPKFYQELGIFPCVAYGTLNAEGTIVSCEGDVLGAISMLALSLASGTQSVIMDMVSVLSEAEAICFWHCGLATWELADADGVRLIARPVPQPNGEVAMVGGFADVTFAPERTVTIARISQNGSVLLTATGRTVGHLGPGYEGSGGWLADLCMAHRPISPTEFLDSIVYEGIEHHYALVPKDVNDALIEASVWLGLRLVKPRHVYDHI